ncbi:hypothetical protein QZH41_015966, partial [Actinostola sp. cb2023]
MFEYISGFWDWTSSVLLPGLYKDGKAYNSSYTSHSVYTIDGDSVLVGIPMITQKRVTKECFQIGFAIAWIVIHVYKMVQVDVTSKLLMVNIHQDNDFENVVLVNDIENILLAFLIFLNTLKLLLSIQFSQIKHFFAVLGGALKDIVSYLVIMFIALVAFVQFGILVFGQNMHEFSNVVESLTTLCAVMIGNPFDFFGIQETNRILGPAYYVLFAFSSILIFVNFLILILIYSFQVQVNRHRHGYGLGRFIIDRLREACGLGKTVLPQEWTEMDSIRLQCHRAKLWFESKTYRRIERQQPLIKRRKLSPVKTNHNRNKEQGTCLPLCGLGT